MRGRARLAAVAVVVAALGACELSEVTITEPQHAVVAEAYVRLGVLQLSGLPPSVEPTPYARVSVLLHETLDLSGASQPVPKARIRITRTGDGLVIPVPEMSAPPGGCARSQPVAGGSTCYDTPLDHPALKALAPGDRLALRIELADGGVLTSETVIPGRFQLLNVRAGTSCAATPLAGTQIVWSRSANAWAYISDTYISGLSRHFPGRDVSDPLYLLGLSVSAGDTAIVFPRQFGVFARGDLDHAVTVALQAGLPDSTFAIVAVAAVDRNWVNWARGGNFNPSGQVRLPSVRGDGTGVFASGVLQAFRVVSDSRPTGLARCPPDEPRD
ncbi:MAG: hypothetical protein EXR95_03175 [Gemmatimonadetes bacterium]|nr:hypothetical protein [Gemmatimonadota bacterium]